MHSSGFLLQKSEGDKNGQVQEEAAGPANRHARKMRRTGQSSCGKRCRQTFSLKTFFYFSHTHTYVCLLLEDVIGNLFIVLIALEVLFGFICFLIHVGRRAKPPWVLKPLKLLLSTECRRVTAWAALGPLWCEATRETCRQGGLPSLPAERGPEEASGEAPPPPPGGKKHSHHQE